MDAETQEFIAGYESLCRKYSKAIVRILSDRGGDHAFYSVLSCSLAEVDCQVSEIRRAVELEGTA